MVGSSCNCWDCIVSHNQKDLDSDTLVIFSIFGYIGALILGIESEVGGFLRLLSKFRFTLACIIVYIIAAVGLNLAVQATKYDKPKYCCEAQTGVSLSLSSCYCKSSMEYPKRIFDSILAPMSPILVLASLGADLVVTRRSGASVSEG